MAWKLIFTPLKLANYGVFPSKNYWIFGFLDFPFRGILYIFGSIVCVCVIFPNSWFVCMRASMNYHTTNLEKKKNTRIIFSWKRKKKRTAAAEKGEKSKMECTFVLEIGHFMVYTVLGDFPALVLLLVVVMLTDLSVLRLSKILL